MPFAASDFATTATGTDFPLNSDITTSSCVDEQGFLPSPEHVDQVNPSTGTFVKARSKVKVLGEVTRHLSKFSSYKERRSEVAQMFGLEGQLEDPQREVDFFFSSCFIVVNMKPSSRTIQCGVHQDIVPAGSAAAEQVRPQTSGLSPEQPRAFPVATEPPPRNTFADKNQGT
ncbi:hypothetical protein CRG98_044318 [Punica granatum]|uniref:Uncharacterized protein n=1 Tax=Punica granatum TaxID=22663 RepID=A0A2I0HUC1_PUNGR|nr:hypothetical protein CRG98_044318 [Punica granatum]